MTNKDYKLDWFNLRVCQVFLMICSAALIASTQVVKADSSCSPTDVQTVLAPAPPLRASSLRRFQEVESQLPRSADVIMIGDSQTQGWPSDILRSTFPGKTVVNWGVGGDRIQNVLWRFDHTIISNFNPSYIILMIGVNNVLDGIKGCAIAEGTITILEKIISIWPNSEIIVFRIFPIGIGYSAREAEIGAVEASVKEYVKNNENVRIINASDEMACYMAHEPSVLEQSMPFWPFYKHCENYESDEVHFSNEGYQTLSNIIKRSME